METILSISIAAYNIADYLAEILDKLMMVENSERLEVLVVNDGSKDETPEIAREYEEKYPASIKLIDKQNGGWGSTVNAGIKNATGKFFKLLDGDDYYHIENMSGFLTYLEQTDSDMVITPFRLFNDKTLELYPARSRREEFDKDTEFTLGDVSSLFAMHEVAFRTQLLQNSPLNISEHCFYTDVEYVAKGMCRVKSISSYPHEIYMYRVAREGQSDSLAGRIKHYKDHLHVIDVLNQLRREFPQNSDEYRLISERLHGMIKRQCNIYLSMKSSVEIKHELMNYDRWVVENCPDIFAETSRTMTILRKTRFHGYHMISWIVRRHEMDT